MKIDGKIFKNKLVPCTGWYGVVKNEDGKLERGASVIAFSVSYRVDPEDHGFISDKFVEPIFQLHDDGRREEFGLMRPDGCIEYAEAVFRELGHLQMYVAEEDANPNFAKALAAAGIGEPQDA